MLRRLRTMRPVAGAMLFAVMAMLSASCLVAENMTHAQKACCAAMSHDCGELAISEGCCTTQAQDGTSFLAASRVEMSAPSVPVLIAVLDRPEHLALDTAGITTSARPAP